jgi:exosortase A-associated hydrolase 1
MLLNSSPKLAPCFRGCQQPEPMPANTVHEVAFCFQCAEQALVGVLSLEDATAQPKAGVIIVVGGPQYRAGSHRQFVLLARHLASAGYAVLRFDVSGMGDSTGPAPNFERLDADIRAAIDALCTAVKSISAVALWGLCDGASAALLYMARSADPRVKALCLVNPWVRSETTQARTTVKHYYRDRLRQRGFWLKLLQGGVSLTALRDLLENLRKLRLKPPPAASHRTTPTPYQQLMAEGWMGFQGQILLLLSGKDYTAREFADLAASATAWKGALTLPTVQRHDLPAADHTFSDPLQRQHAEQVTAQWLANTGLPKASL